MRPHHPFGLLPYSGVIAALALVMTGCVDRAAQQQAKQTQKLVSDPVHVVSAITPVHRLMTETLEITGSVTTSEDSSVNPKSGGKLVAVYVKDGDTVQAGQVVAVEDTTTLQAQQQAAVASLQQAQANVASAQSQLSQAIENAQIGPAKSTSAVDQALSQVRSAKANLDKLLSGARPEERKQTEASLASAKSNLATQAKELERTKKLVDEGALAGTKLDAQQATYDAAKATYDTAVLSVRLQEIGNRSEDIESAKETLRQAQEALKTAIDNKKLDTLLFQQVDGAKAALASSRAQVENAEAQVKVANQALADAMIRAPFAGRVSGKPVQPGTFVGTGVTVLRVIGNGGVYFDGQIPAESVPRVAVGDPVDVTVDGFPGQSFKGSIAAINPLGSSYGRQFSVRVQFQGQFAQVKPGMYARGEVIVKSVPDATVIPLNVIVTKDGRKLIFTVEDGKARSLPITLGIERGDQVQVLGIPAGISIVSKGQDSLVDGTPVRVEQSVQESKATASAAAGSVGG